MFNLGTVLAYERDNQKLSIEEEQTIEWPKRKRTNKDI